jgi:hypothetical protein
MLTGGQTPGTAQLAERTVAALRRAVARGDLPPDADAELIVDVRAGAIA